MKLYVLTDGEFFGAFTTRENAEAAKRKAVTDDPSCPLLDIVEIDSDVFIEDFDAMPTIDGFGGAQ